MQSWTRGIPILLLLLWSAAGCGLSEYQKRMDEQSRKLKIYDEENKALGDPLEAPVFVDPKTSAAKPALAVEFFLRPPKGTASKVADLKEPKAGKLALVHYAGPAGFNVLVSASRVAAEVKDQKPKEGELTTKAFQKQVRQLLGEFNARETKRSIDWSGAVKTETKGVLVPAAKGPPVNVNFDYQTLTDDPNPAGKNPPKNVPDTNEYHDFRVYFYQNGIEQAAIVYQIPAADRMNGEVNKGIDFSIRSFGLGVDAMMKRQEFNKRKR